MRSNHNHEWLRQVAWAIFRIERKLMDTLVQDPDDSMQYRLDTNRYDPHDDLMDNIDWVVQTRIGLHRGVRLTTGRLRLLLAEACDGYGGELGVGGRVEPPTSWSELKYDSTHAYDLAMTWENWSYVFRDVVARFVYESAIAVYGEGKALEIAEVCMAPDTYLTRSQYWDELDGFDAQVRRNKAGHRLPKRRASRRRQRR